MIKKKTTSRFENERRILPVYRLILREIELCYFLAIPFFLLLPLFFAIVVTVLIILGILNEKRKNSTGGLLTSPWRSWKNHGYDPRALSAILISMVITLLTANVLVQPLIFDLLVKLFYLLF